MFIDSITIENFKGFSQEIKIENASGRNILIYGENGSGKSSLYDALRLAFFYGRLEYKATDGAIDKADEDLRRNRWLSGFVHNGSASFKVEINGLDFDRLPTAGVDCFMLNHRNARHLENEMSMVSMLENLDYPDIPADFVKDHAELIIDEVNKSLKKDFCEDIELSLDGSKDYRIIIEDKTSGLKRSKDLPMYFNEAKLTIIALLIKLSAIELLGDSGHEKVLVLDDIISSMDAANRAFFTTYIFSHFARYQKIVLTHNASYYNLFRESAWIRERGLWTELLLLISGDTIVLSDASCLLLRDAEQLKSDYNSGRISPSDMGNKLRQLFESRIHQLAVWLQLEPVDQSGLVISNLLSPNKKVYLRVDRRTIFRAEDLVKEVTDILSDTTKTDNDKVRDCNAKIAEYDCKNELTKLIPIISEVRLYQKLILHQLSHGRSGLPTFSSLEVEKCLDLLKSLDKSLADVSKNIYEA